MEVITKNFKLIGGIVLIVCCLLPFYGVLGFSVNGFALFSAGFLGLLAILLILAGAAALIYVSVTKDMVLAPKFTLSYAAKLAALAGGILAAIASNFMGIGIGLILEIIIAVVLLFEDKIVKALNGNKK